MKECDLAIIGAGPGGYTAAIRAAQLGLKTICIDKRAELGGTCLNVGCIPSKSLLQSTELLSHLQQKGGELGVIFSDLSFDFSQMMKRKSQIIKNLMMGIEGSFKNYNVEFLRGQARFINTHLLAVETGNGSEEVMCKSVLIATGSEPIGLPFLPLDERRILSSTGALSLYEVPKRMIVVGGGSIGLELASVYNRLGTEVILIEMLDRICYAMDHSISEQLLLSLKKQGIKISLLTQVITAVIQPEEVILTVSNEDKLENLSANVVLVAIGRKPYTAGMDLDKGGIQVDQKGFIKVDKSFQTIQKNIFAIGDVIEGPMLAHRASEEGVAVVEMLAKAEINIINEILIPNIIYTSPEVACVGITEEEAKKNKINVLIGKSYFKGNARARCANELEGFVKIIGEKNSGRLIGLHLLGAHVSELIAQGMISIYKQATLHDLAYAPFGHPTYSEAIKEAALTAIASDNL